MSALVLNEYNPPPRHRQNRRRERPGSRSRRTITRKSHINDTCLEGLYDSRDANLYLPSVKATPSPLLRQSFDQNWERWKAREAEEKALAELDKTLLEQEQRRLFGGDVGDDELYALGILYDDSDAAVISVNEIQPAPAFVVRTRKSKKTHLSAREKPTNDISFPDLRNDVVNAQTTPHSPSIPSPIQHRSNSNYRSTCINSHAQIVPQSLPSPSALQSIPESYEFIETHFSSLSAGDWTFVHAAQHTPMVSASTSEPETWILLGDDL